MPDHATLSKRFLSSRLEMMIAGGIAISLLVAAVRFGFQLGNHNRGDESVTKSFFRADIAGRRTSPPENGTRFVIRGRSMLPTLTEGAVCEVASLDPAMKSPLKRGDLVAVHFAQSNHVKRVAGLPGDRIELRHGRLLFNGRRLEDWIAGASTKSGNNSLPVPPATVEVASGPEGWQLTSDGNWIVYHHRDPYRSGQPSPIRDDYPMNVDVKRMLHPADRLIVQFDSSTRPRQVLFSINREVLAVPRPGGLARSRDAEPIAAQGATSATVPPELSDSHPIAIEINGDESVEAFARTLRVLREIEYRDDARHRKTRYPMTLGAEQFFVLGDNVPVSVDSREVGPLPLSAVLGRVISCQ